MILENLVGGNISRKKSAKIATHHITPLQKKFEKIARVMCVCGKVGKLGKLCRNVFRRMVASRFSWTCNKMLTEAQTPMMHLFQAFYAHNMDRINTILQESDLNVNDHDKNGSTALILASR